MSDVLWAAVIAGGVSAVGNVTTMYVARKSNATAMHAASEGNATTLTVARQNNETTLKAVEGGPVKTAIQERFAAWQLRKREVYAAFLDAAKELRDAENPSEQLKSKYMEKGHRVLLHAYEEARETVLPLMDDPAPLRNPDTWTRLMDVLREDVHLQGPAT